jgi:hypothetical protein
VKIFGGNNMKKYYVRVDCANYLIENFEDDHRKECDDFIEGYSIDGWNDDLKELAYLYGVHFEIYYNMKYMSHIHRSFKKIA